MTKIYHYSPLTGEFTGEGLADPSPLEEEVWLVPAHATVIEPPGELNDERAVWTGEAWELREDHRGRAAWLADGTGLVVADLGPLPDGASFAPPASVSAEQRRHQRDRLLAASDWTQLADTLLDQPELKAAWAAYRSQLRRLDLDGSDWPEAPIDTASN